MNVSKRQQNNPHAELCAWANGLRIDSPKSEVARCPTCSSPDPKRHPAMQFEGEVELCNDDWHQPTADEIRANGKSKR